MPVATVTGLVILFLSSVLLSNNRVSGFTALRQRLYVSLSPPEIVLMIFRLKMMSVKYSNSKPKEDGSL